MKRSWCVLILLLFALLAIHVNADKNTAPRKPVVVLFNSYSPPYSFVDENGEVKGFNVDIMAEVMRRLHQPCIFKAMEWPKAVDAFDTHKCDLLVGMKYTDKRALKYTFGPVLSYMFIVSVYRKGDPHVSTVSELRGRRVAVVDKTQLSEILESENPAIPYSPMDNTDRVLNAVSQGKIDATITYGGVAQYIMSREMLRNLVMSDVGLAPTEDRMVGYNQMLLNKITGMMFKLKADGYYSDAYSEWFSSPAERYSKYIYGGITALLLVVLVTLFFIYLLRSKVRKANSQLRVKSDSLSLALNASEIGVWRFDVDDACLYSVEGNFFPREGLPFKTAIKMVHPEDRDMLVNDFHGLVRGTPINEPRCYRVSSRQKRGWQYIEIRSRLMSTGGKTVNMIVGTYKNVTEKHRLEESIKDNADRVEMAIHASNMVLWEINSDTMLTQCYNSPIPLLNERPVTMEELLAQVHPDDLKKALPFVDIVQKGIDTEINMEVRLKYPTDGKWHSCKITGRAFKKDEDTGRIMSYVGFSVDITNLIEIQHNLELEKEKALAADRLKSEFLANMSHEIRTPLNAIVGFNDILRYVTDDKEKDQCFSIIQKNTDVLLNLVNDILDLSKIESGMLEITPSEFDITDLFHIAETTLGRLDVKSPDVELVCDLPYDTCIINADSQRVNQIITNFVTNAFKYTEKGHVKMSYLLENGGVRIMVEDTGIGIPKDKLNDVFERFEKLGSFKQGTGLGLSICKAIIDRCGGKIGVDSELGKGSTFWAWFPCDVISKK